MSDKIFSLFSFRLYIGVIAALGVVSNTLILPALPMIGAELGGAAGIAVWTMTAFLLGATVGQFCWGPVSDSCGRRPPLYWGLTIVLASCIAGFFAETVTQIMMARFFQGLGASAGNTLARAISRDCYTGHAFDQMIAWIFTIIPLASGLSPLLGGIFQSFFGWRSCFLFLFLMVVLLMGATSFFLKPLPHFRQKISLGKMIGEYRVILSSSQNVWTLLCIGSIFISHFGFLTGFPYVVTQFYDLQNWFVSLLFMAFPLGTFGGGLYQFVWGWKKLSQKNLQVCWGMVFFSVVVSFIIILMDETAILVYLVLMMFFGWAMSIINSITSSFLLRCNKPTIAGALSSLIGVVQTLSAALGSFLASWTTNSFLSITFVAFGTLGCFLLYRQIEWKRKEPFSDLELAPLS